MKTKLIRALSFLLKGLALFVGLQSLPFMTVLPSDGKMAALAVFLFALASTLKDAVYLLLDWLDDGKINRSVTMALLICLLPAGALTSCAGWDVKFQAQAGVTPGQAVGVIGDAMVSFERARAANLARQALTSGKDVEDVEVQEHPAETGLGWMGSLKGLWDLVRGK